MFPPRPAAAFKSSMAAARSSSDSSVEQYLGFHGLPWVSKIYMGKYIYVCVYVSIGAPASSSFGQSKSKPCHALHLTIMCNCIYFLKYVEKYMTSSTYGMPYIILCNVADQFLPDYQPKWGISTCTVSMSARGTDLQQLRNWKLKL